MGQYLTTTDDYLTIVYVCNTTIDGPATVGWFTISIVTETAQ